MARKPPQLKVVISPRALNALDEIWDWNAGRYDVDHADNYVDFLTKKTKGLASAYLTGRVVATAPELRYIVIKRTSKGQGHVAVYEITDDQVNVLNFYHTAQDWQGKLARGEW